MESFWYKVKLIVPQYARPFVKRQKNDAANAEAIVIAARQGKMRFVEPKTIDQQSHAVVYSPSRSGNAYFSFTWTRA